MKKSKAKKIIRENIAAQENATQYLRDLHDALAEAKKGSTLAFIMEHMDKAISRIERTNENIKLIISS